MNRWSLSAYDRQPAALGFEAVGFVTAGHVNETLAITICRALLLSAWPVV